MLDSVYKSDSGNLEFRTFHGCSDVYVSICMFGKYFMANISQKQADCLASQIFAALGYSVKRLSAPRHPTLRFGTAYRTPSLPAVLSIEIFMGDSRSKLMSGEGMLAFSNIKGRELIRLSKWLAKNLDWELSG